MTDSDSVQISNTEKWSLDKGDYSLHHQGSTDFLCMDFCGLKFKCPLFLPFQVSSHELGHSACCASTGAAALRRPSITLSETGTWLGTNCCAILLDRNILSCEIMTDTLVEQKWQFNVDIYDHKIGRASIPRLNLPPLEPFQQSLHQRWDLVPFHINRCLDKNINVNNVQSYLD